MPWPVMWYGFLCWEREVAEDLICASVETHVVILRGATGWAKQSHLRISDNEACSKAVEFHCLEHSGMKQLGENIFAEHEVGTVRPRTMPWRELRQWAAILFRDLKSTRRWLGGRYFHEKLQWVDGAEKMLVL